MPENKAISLATAPTGFLQFYWKVLRYAVLEELFSAKEKAEKVVTTILTILLLFNKQLAERARVQWEGLSVWWAIVPIILLFFYGLMKANHAHFELEREARFKAEEKQKELVDAKQLKYEWERLGGKFSYDYGPDVQAGRSQILPVIDPNKRSWFLLGGQGEEEIKNLELVFQEAGRLLNTSRYANEEFEWLKTEAEPIARWLGFVLEHERDGKQISGTGFDHGVSYQTGEIYKIPKASAFLCNLLASKENWPI